MTTLDLTDAACRGMDLDLFFPKQGHSARSAKAVCARCPIRTQCAQRGADEYFGVFGGLAPRDRGKKSRAPIGAADSRRGRAA